MWDWLNMVLKNKVKSLAALQVRFIDRGV